MTSIPEHVTQFLLLSKQLSDLRKDEASCREGLAKLQPIVGAWLRDVPSYEIELEFNEIQEQRFGTTGKLRLGVDSRREYLSQVNLFGYLSSFFKQMYPNKPDEEIEHLSKAASSHIWQSRKTTRNQQVVVRTFSKKKKRDT